MAKIYKQPFAHEGDAIAIPSASQPDGKMSNADGWTPDYQLPKTDPNYKPVGRQEMNGVFKEVTEALGQVQVQGAATWSPDGAPYPINAQVYHNGKQWLALRANSVEPAESADWTELVGKQYVDAATNRIGLIDYGYVAKDHHVVAFGGVFNRADYPKLWAYLQENPTLVKTDVQWHAEAAANSGVCGFFSDDNGTTTFRVPNLDTAFLRPSIRGVGSYEGDAIRNITGTVGDILNITSASSGVFSMFTSGRSGYGTNVGDFKRFSFDASRVVPTAHENRPKNIAVLPLIVAK